MRKNIFVLLLLSFPAQAYEKPPQCWEPYLYVKEYGRWSLNDGIWRLPFTCTSGVSAEVNVAEQNVMDLGMAEYYVHSPEFENDTYFFSPEPCASMGKFCQYAVLPRENIPTLYDFDDQVSPKRFLP